MVPELTDTIVALASAPGPGARAIVRLCGSKSWDVISPLFKCAEMQDSTKRQCLAGEFVLPGLMAPLPADVYHWPAPRTYTGQRMVEVHTLGSPPLVELLITECLRAGARAAQPGEFTLRAFLAGKLDLTRAEAVLAVIEADGRDELKRALAQLAGGIARPLEELRQDLLNLLADLEAGLDFSDDDIRFVKTDEMLHRITRALAMVTLVHKQLEERSLQDRAYRVVLAGPANAGKSSLFNALASAARALVSPTPGTTRDYLVQRLQIEGAAIDLVDTAGMAEKMSPLDEKAQALGRGEIDRADLVVWCCEGGRGDGRALPQAPCEVLSIATKSDLYEPPRGMPATSAKSGSGLAELRRILSERARKHSRPASAPSLSRCRHHVDHCLDNLRRAHAEVLDDAFPELIALELRNTLEELGAMVGAVYTDDLLDRIFSRFCIGK